MDNIDSIKANYISYLKMATIDTIIHIIYILPREEYSSIIIIANILLIAINYL